MNEIRRKHLLTFVIFIVSFSIRVSYLTTMEPQQPMGTDSVKYANIAINVADGKRYNFATTDESIAWIQPSYPLFLASIAMFSENFTSFFTTTVYLQSFLSAISVCLIFLIACSMQCQIAGVIAATLTAFSPHLTVFTGYMLTETLFIFLVTLSLYFLCLWNKKSVIGFLVAFVVFATLASLTRPVYLLVPVAYLALLLILQQNATKFKKIAIVTLCTLALVQSPWLLWSKLSKQELNQPSLFRIAFHLGSYPNLQFNDGPKGFPRLADPDYLEASNQWNTVFSHFNQRFQHNPSQFIWWYTVGKPMMFWKWSILQGQGGPFVYTLNKSIYTERYFYKKILTIYEFTHNFIVLFVFIGGFISIAILFKRRLLDRYETPVFMFTILLYYTGVHTVLAPLPRYSMVLHPFLYCLFAYGLVKLIAQVKNYGK